MTSAEQQEQLLADVLSTFGDSPNRRLGQIMEAAVRHLHNFVSEVGLTRDEWMTGIEFLTAVGQMCTPTRQEFILLSDTLGVSSLVEMIGFDGAPGTTENTVLGPFYVPGSPVRQHGESIVAGEQQGTPLVIRGRVTDLAGQPVPGATLDVWQTAANGLYAVQDPEQHPENLRGKFAVGDDGRFEFRTVRPAPYLIPSDGPVGRLLASTGRHPWRAAHTHIIARAPGYKTLTTHVFDAASDYLDSDAVFGVRDSLIVKFTGDGDDLTGDFDIVLERGIATGSSRSATSAS
jgi:protocatechuate 3,4-dioxygenase beta subunit